MRTVFVCGIPRSGTTIVQSILDSHRGGKVSITNESDFLQFWRRNLSKVGIRYGKQPDTFVSYEHDFLTKRTNEKLAEVFHEFHAFRKPNAEIIGDKNPYYIAYLDWIRERFPKSQFILLTREKEATLQSMRDYFTGIEEKYVRNIYDGCIPHFEANKDKEDCYVVQLEEIQEGNAPEVFNGIAQFIGVEPDFDFSLLR